MKKAFIIHGWGGSPEEPLHKWLKLTLEQEGYVVVVPEMPDPEVPKIDAWINKIKEVTENIDEETVFIGHSIGCQAILRYLETLTDDIKIGNLILIAPWMQLDEKTIKEEGEEVKEMARPWIETPIDFLKVRARSNRTTAIFSDNDPYVPLIQKSLFEKGLGAKIIIEKKKGHFTADDGVERLPSALEAVLKIR